MFPMYFYVSNLQFPFPILFLCFQSTFFVSSLIFMFPMYLFCFQTTCNVSNLFRCFQSTMFPIHVSNPHITVFLFINKQLQIMIHYQNKNNFVNDFHLLKIVSLVSDERTPISSASESTSLSQLH